MNRTTKIPVIKYRLPYDEEIEVMLFDEGMTESEICKELKNEFYMLNEHEAFQSVEALSNRLGFLIELEERQIKVKS